MENVARRAAQIIEAYRVDPTRPAWSTVKYFVDEASALDPVPLSLRQANTRKIKDEIEVDAFRLRQRVPVARPTAETQTNLRRGSPRSCSNRAVMRAVEEANQTGAAEAVLEEPSRLPLTNEWR